MRILLLYPFLVHEKATHGSALMLLQYVKHLGKNNEVSLVCLMEEDEKKFLPFTKTIKECCKEFFVFPKPKAALQTRLARYLFYSKPNYPVDIFSPAIATDIREKLVSYEIDIYHVIFTVMGEYLLNIDDTRCKKVLTADQPYFRDYERSLRAGGRATLWALPRLLKWLKMKRYERSLCRAVDRVIAISPEERKALSDLAPGVNPSVIPTGVDCSLFQPSESESSEPSVVFLGNFRHPPNVDGAMWFARSIWPQVTERMPNARLTLIGADPPPSVRNLAMSPNIVVTGTVDDVKPWLANGWIFVCPMRIGGGARGKVLEAMAIGKPVVSTSVGIEGILGIEGQDFVVANEPSDFAAAVVDLLDNREKRQAISASARAMVERRHDWAQIVKDLEGIYQELTQS